MRPDSIIVQLTALKVRLRQEGLSRGVEERALEAAIDYIVRTVHGSGERAEGAKLGRELAARRKTFGAGTGRPAIITRCEKCGLEAGKVAMRNHHCREQKAS
jgi:hypothetical protein